MPDCGRPFDSLGFCKRHAARLRRHGTPNGRNALFGATLRDRVELGLPLDRNPSACWPWQRSRNANGYGIVSTPQGRTRAVRRAAYEEFVGPVPRSLDLDHLCRNKACCNPAHLEPVTRSENNRRMWQHRRVSA